MRPQENCENFDAPLILNKFVICAEGCKCRPCVYYKTTPRPTPSCAVVKFTAMPNTRPPSTAEPIQHQPRPNPACGYAQIEYASYIAAIEDRNKSKTNFN